MCLRNPKVQLYINTATKYLLFNSKKKWKEKMPGIDVIHEHLQEKIDFFEYVVRIANFSRRTLNMGIIVFCFCYK